MALSWSVREFNRGSILSGVAGDDGEAVSLV
jgi:hypothetical protein